jgi:hypothetical protein
VTRAGRKPGRLNRVLLTLLGVVFLAAGGFGLAVHFGRLTVVKSTASVLPHQERPPTWVFYLVAAVAIAVGLLCLRWLASQVAVRTKTRTWQLEPDPGRGRTELGTGVAVAPFAEEVTGYPGVRAVRAALTGTHRDPALAMTITAATDADLTEIRSRLAVEGLPRLCEALDLSGLPATVEFRVPPG